MRGDNHERMIKRIVPYKNVIIQGLGMRIYCAFRMNMIRVRGALAQHNFKSRPEPFAHRRLMIWLKFMKVHWS